MAGRLLIFAILFGAAIGLILPNGKPRPPAPQQVATVAAPAPTQMRSANGIETILERRPDGHFYVDAMVNGQLVHFVVDTGASMVALTSEDARRVGFNFSPADFITVGRGASGDVRGIPLELDSVAIGNNEARGVRAAIIAEGLDVSLLGQSFLSRIGSVTIRDDRMVLK